MSYISPCEKPTIKKVIKITVKKEETEKGYKICTVCDGVISSAFRNGIVTIYKKNKWTERQKTCGPFAVFSKKKNTKQLTKFLNDRYNLFIFKCKYVESEENFLYYTDNFGTIMKNCLIDSFPIGTVFADKVKILKR